MLVELDVAFSLICMTVPTMLVHWINLPTTHADAACTAAVLGGGPVVKVNDTEWYTMFAFLLLCSLFGHAKLRGSLSEHLAPERMREFYIAFPWLVALAGFALNRVLLINAKLIMLCSVVCNSTFVVTVQSVVIALEAQY